MGGIDLSFFYLVGVLADIGVILVLLIGCALVLGLLYTLILHSRLVDSGIERERRMLAKAMPPEAELPAVLVQIPTFNERALVWRALAAVTAFDWPRDRLHVQVLDDSTDESAEIARAAVAEYRRRGHNVELVQRSNRAGFKAGALRDGLAITDQPYVVIFDADYVPKADFLRLCMRALLADPALAFVQARCDFLNGDENLLTRAQQALLDHHFGLEQATRFWAGQVLPFNGSCGVWRRAAIEDAGGWQGDTVTEDLDLSYRTQIAGWRAAHLVSVSAPGELPSTLAAWQRQQLRWNKGFAQTARKLLPVIWHDKVSWRRRLEALLHLGSCIYGIQMVIGVLLFSLDLALGTMSYLIVFPLLAVELTLGLAGGVRLHVLGQNLFREMGVSRPQKGWADEAATSVVSVLVQAYSGVVTAWGVLLGLRGTHAVFERTPKRGGPIGAAGESGASGIAV